MLRDNPGSGDWDWDWDDKISSVWISPFADPGGPYIGHEGSKITLDTANRCYGEYRGTDSNNWVTFEWSVDSSVCTLSDETARQPTLTCADNGDITIGYKLYEGAVLWYDVPETVFVENVAPVVTAEGSTIDENGWAIVSGTITDPGTEDTFTVEIDWGDGSDTYNYPAGTTIYSQPHQFLGPDPPGVYPVTVTMTDDDGGIGTANTSVNGDLVFLPLALKD